MAWPVGPVMRRILLALPLVAGCAGPPCGPGERCLVREVVPLTTRALAIAARVDVDGDGVLDFVGVAGAAIVIRRGGTGAPELVPLAGSGTGLVTGDVDGDGRVDAVVSTSDPPGLAWLRGGATARVRVLELESAPGAMVAGDLEGDGDVDLVVRVAGEMRVFRGGAEGLVAGESHALEDVGDFAVADLAGDGGLDLAVVRPERGTVEHYAIAEDGALARVGRLWRTEVPTAVVFADLDEDGAIDVAAADRLRRELLVRFGDGAGGWRGQVVHAVESEPVTLAARRGPAGMELVVKGADGGSLGLIDAASGATRVAAMLTFSSSLELRAVDVDGDGVEELMRGEAVIAEVAGFAARRVWAEAAGLAVDRVALVDLGGDAAPELVAHDPAREELVIHATAEAATELARVSVGPAWDDLRVLDEGRTLAWWGGATLTLRVDEVTTEIGMAGAITEVVADPQGLYVVAGGGLWRISREVDGALGEPEAVFMGPRITGVALAGPGDPWIAHADGVSRLQEEVVSPLRELRGVAFADVDADGVVDFVGCRNDGVFAARGEDGEPLRVSERPCARVEVCDLDEDGAPELLLAQVRASESLGDAAGIEVLAAADGGWTSRGAFGFGLQADRFALDCAGRTLWTGGALGLARAELVPGPALREATPRVPGLSPLVADLDGDGRDELVGHDGAHLVYARPGDRTPRLAPPQGEAVVAVAELDGAPGAEVLVRRTATSGVGTHDVLQLRGDRFVRTGTLAIDGWSVLGDFDGDGRDEMIVPVAEGNVRVRPGVDGRIESDVLADMFEGQPVRAADVDRDGRVDLLVLGSTGPGISIDVVRSRGADGFEPPRTWLSSVNGVSSPAIAVGDLDGDGRHDLVYADSRDGRVLVCTGAATPGCRGVPWVLGSGVGAQAAIGDVDRDGAMDVIVEYLGDGEAFVQVLRGDGTGRLFATPPIGVPGFGRLERARAESGDVWLVVSRDVAQVLAWEGP